jgi:YtkA-like protein
MKLAAALLSMLLATGCSAATAAVPTPTAVPDAPILASEGGVLRPIDNGGRLPMKMGYATVRLWPSPQSMDPNLQVALFDASGQAATADVFVVSEMLDMEHGTETIPATVRDGFYQMHLSFGMPGSWRLVVHVKRDAAEETITLVLPWIGL